MNEAVSAVYRKFNSFPRRADMIRVAVVGDPKVGKSAFIKCAVFGFYDPYLQSNMPLDFMTREVHVANEQIVVQFWESVPRSFNCIIVMYDVTERRTFANAMKILEDIRAKHPVDLPILLLSNKIDTDKKRQVMMYEGELLALQHGCLFNEVSCTEATNVRMCLSEFISSMLCVYNKITMES